jgi:hypothetical protein
MANLALPEPGSELEPEYDYDPPQFYFVLQGKPDRPVADKVADACMRESTGLFLVNQEWLVSAGNC